MGKRRRRANGRTASGARAWEIQVSDGVRVVHQNAARVCWRCAPIVAGLDNHELIDAHKVVNAFELSRENGTGDTEIIAMSSVNALVELVPFIVCIHLLRSAAKGAEHLSAIVLILLVRPNVICADAGWGG